MSSASTLLTTGRITRRRTPTGEFVSLSQRESYDRMTAQMQSASTTRQTTHHIDDSLDLGTSLTAALKAVTEWGSAHEANVEDLSDQLRLARQLGTAIGIFMRARKISDDHALAELIVYAAAQKLSLHDTAAMVVSDQRSRAT